MLSKKGFTLIELLVVIAIIAILSVVVILTLNPAELLRQSRDSTRLSDMATVSNALGIFSANNTSANALGISSITYISIPDQAATSTQGDQCQGLGLPALSTGLAYQCAASSNGRNTDGTGWIPVNFNSLPTGSPIGNLPVDSANQSSSGLFYTYSTDGSNYEVTSILESQKYKTQFSVSPQNTLFPEAIIKGSNLSLSGLFNASGLVGYWPMDEGTGSTVIDQSGNGNNGTWGGTPGGINSTYYTVGKLGPYAGNFNGSNNYLDLGSSTIFNITSSISMIGWFSTISTTNGVLFGKCYSSSYYVNTSNGYTSFETNNIPLTAGPIAVNDGSFHQFAATFDGTTKHLYIDGVLRASGAGTITTDSYDLKIGMAGCPSTRFNGTIDDIRLYNRALSPAEIQALYTSEK